MIQLVGLGKSHINRGLDSRLAFRCLPFLDNQADLAGADIADGTQALPALAVTYQHLLAAFDPQHLGVLGILPGQDQKIRL